MPHHVTVWISLVVIKQRLVWVHVIYLQSLENANWIDSLIDQKQKVKVSFPTSNSLLPSLPHLSFFLSFSFSLSVNKLSHVNTHICMWFYLHTIWNFYKHHVCAVVCISCWHFYVWYSFLYLLFKWIQW